MKILKHRKSKLLFLIIIFIGIFNSSKLYSNSTCDSLTLLKKSIYGFYPSDLSDSLQNLKNKELDIFWNTAMKSRTDAVDCLKFLIENENNDPYFCYDASALLLQMDTSTKYLPTIQNGLQKCRLKDLQLEYYLKICSFLSYKGVDIGELILKLINSDVKNIYLREHVISISLIDASVLLLNTLPIEKAEQLLIRALKENNDNSKNNAAKIFSLISTRNGDIILDSLIKNKELNKNTIDFIKSTHTSFKSKEKTTYTRTKILECLNDEPYNFAKNYFGFAGNQDLINSAYKLLTTKDIELIRKARSKSTPNISDESLYEYYTLTSILIYVRNKK